VRAIELFAAQRPKEYAWMTGPGAPHALAEIMRVVVAASCARPGAQGEQR